MIAESGEKIDFVPPRGQFFDGEFDGRRMKRILVKIVEEQEQDAGSCRASANGPVF